MTQSLASTLQQQTATPSLASADHGVPCPPWLSLPGGGSPAALNIASGRAEEDCIQPDQSVSNRDGEGDDELEELLGEEDLQTIMQDLNKHGKILQDLEAGLVSWAWEGPPMEMTELVGPLGLESPDCLPSQPCPSPGLLGAEPTVSCAEAQGYNQDDLYAQR